MWFCKRKKEDNSYCTETENVKLQQKINHLEDQIKQYKERLEGDFAKASFSVDWAAMNVFSIERNMAGLDGTKTILGYMMAEPVTTVENDVTYKDVVREWTLYCSHEEHERLVAEFNEYRNSK